MSRPFALLFVLALWLAACQPTPAPVPATSSAPATGDDITAFVDQVMAGPHETVTSADGQAALLIPPGALPSGTTAADISIRPMDPALALEASGQPPPLMAFQLEPDGLRFAAPVLLRLTPAAGDGAIYRLWQIAGGQVSALGPAQVELVAASEVVTISVALEHFSQVAVGKSGLFLTMSAPQTVGLGATFAATIGISTAPEGGGQAPPAGSEPDEFRIYNGRWNASGGLSPTLVPNAPADDQSQGMFYVREQDFTCQTPGLKNISYRADVDYRYDYATFQALPQTHTSVARTDILLNCVAFTPTPTPTPTPSSTPTPTPTPSPTPREVSCAPGLDGLRQCLDDAVTGQLFGDGAPDRRIANNTDPATLYRNPAVLALLNAPGVTLLHNYYSRPVNCPLTTACVLHTLLIEFASEADGLAFFELVAGPGTGMPGEAEVPAPNAAAWDASKCARGTRPSGTQGTPDFAVLYCSVSEGSLHWGFNLSAYEDLPDGLLEEDLDYIMNLVHDYLSVWQ